MSDIRVSGYGGRDGGVSLSGCTREEQDGIRGVVQGTQWMTVQHGRAVFVSTHQQLPSPTADADMLPFWRRATTDEKSTQLKLLDSFDPTDKIEHHFPSFMIQHLCGYNYTEANYIKMANLLEGYGFECLRSRRGREGRYWEIWILGGTYAAEGALKYALEERETAKGGRLTTTESTDLVVSFLCRTASFGTLDVVIQRAAMSLDGE